MPSHFAAISGTPTALGINSKPLHGLGFLTIFPSLLSLPRPLVLPVLQAHRSTFFSSSNAFSLLPQGLARAVPSACQALPPPSLPRDVCFPSSSQFTCHSSGTLPGSQARSGHPVWQPHLTGYHSQHSSSYRRTLVGVIIGLSVSILD